MKKLLVLLCVITVLFTGCGSVQETYSNGVPTYFLEPEGCVIAYVECSGWFDDAYGYITNDDYQDYLDGTITGALVVQNPYEKGKSLSVNVNKIESIETGDYEDYRDQLE